MIQLFEKALWWSRLIIIIPVISSILAAFVLILLGSYKMFSVVYGIGVLVSDPNSFKVVYKDIISNIISSVDVFLIATVLIIFALGLYELFISKIDVAENDKNSSKILVIHSLDELKDRLANVIIMVLIVTFFNAAFTFHYDSIASLAMLAGGILLIALTSHIMHLGHKNNSTH